MRAGYYIDITGDIATRYPDGTWIIMNGSYNHKTAHAFQYTGIWFIDGCATRDDQAKLEDWDFIGGL